ncbi:hypothetical protein LOD99_6593 [Oopsacas minuta]|uniref:SANT and BTB domain-containing protein n=1 Tax=Oopsacas minuta TaxID=111878 RepID=A0AAV7JMQ2_9METZ|nr:hypothetical protein LOD99_6593 [Oopsacas minuta]
MNSLKQRNTQKQDINTPGLAYRLVNKDAHCINGVKSSKSLPSLSSPDPIHRHPLPSNSRLISPPDCADLITIRVIDDAHALTKNFICPASLLLSSMTYFRDNLSTYQDNWQEIDISVHCDLQVFSWLMDYIMSSSPHSLSHPRPKLDAKRVFSVLVSSEYLGMPDLVYTCILFISENINAVLAMHTSTECLNQLSIDKLSNLLTCAQVEEIQDPKDLIRDKLFASKLKIIIDSYNNDNSQPFALNSVYKCLDCQHCIISGLESMFLCGSCSTQIRVSHQGSLFYMHRRDPIWSVRQELDDMRRQGASARDRFWRAWGYSRLLFCSACKYCYIACDVNTCSHIGQVGKLRPNPSNFILIPSLLPSGTSLHSLEYDETAVSGFEDVMNQKIAELRARAKDTPDISIWTRHIFDSSVNQLTLQFNLLFATKSNTNIQQEPPATTSLSGIQLFSPNAFTTSLTRSQFYSLREEVTSPPPNPIKHRPNRSSSRDSNSRRNLKMRPFTGSVNGELEMGTEGEEDEKSEADSRTVSSLTKSRSISSQQSMCSENAKDNACTWDLLRSRKSNIDLQRETEYIRSYKVSSCVQNLVLSKQENRHTNNQQQTNNSISERIDRNFKASLTSNKLQKYQQTTNPKLKKNYSGKQ